MRRMLLKQSGFSTVEVLLAIFAIVGIAAASTIIAAHQHANKINVVESAATSSSQQTATQPMSNSPTKPPTADWPVYTNSKYGFSFSYPATWRVEPGDLASSLDEQNTELVLWLVDTSAPGTQNHAAYIEVSSRDLISKTAIVDGSIDSEGGKSADNKQSLKLKNKDTVKYTIPQSNTVNRVMYFFSVGTKTYSVQTIHEDTNIARNPDYINQFNTLVDSLRLQ